MTKKTFSITWKATLTFKQWWLKWCPEIKQKDAKKMWDRLGTEITIRKVNDCGPTDTTELGYACDDGLDDGIRYWTEQAEQMDKIEDS
jgi:hypothetical protein